MNQTFDDDLVGTIGALRATLTSQHEANDRLREVILQKDVAIERLLNQHRDLVSHLEAASALLTKPTELVLGRNMVHISIGKIEGKAVVLLEPMASPDEPLPPVGAARGAGSIKPGSASLVLDGQAGLDALMKAVELGYLELTGDYSPAHRLLRTCVEFIEKQQIICAEATVEDRVYEHAPELVEAICEIVGYHRDPDDGDEEDEA